MVTITIKTDFKDVDRKLRALSDNLQRKVIPAALNKVIAKARTEMTRAITSEFNLKSSEVRARLRLIKAAKSFDKWQAVLDPFASSRRGRSLNLIQFIKKTRSNAKSVGRKKSAKMKQLEFQIKRAGGKKTITGAFIGNQGRTVFIREGDSRTPIKALSTIDVPTMFNTRRIQTAVLARIDKELALEFDSAIRAALRGNIR